VESGKRGIGAKKKKMRSQLREKAKKAKFLDDFSQKICKNEKKRVILCGFMRWCIKRASKIKPKGQRKGK